MVENNSQEFGNLVVTKIREHIQQNQITWSKLTGNVVAYIVQGVYDSFTGEPELPFEADPSVSLPELGGTRRPRKEPPERNPLFDRLALLTGCADLAQITKSENRTIGVALAEIKKATPDVTPDEIERRILCYKRAHRDWQLTPTALAKHWSEFAINPETNAQKLDPYKTPENWRYRFNQTFPGIEPPAEWSEISVPLRTDILRKTT